jgi:hypothetical protein
MKKQLALFLMSFFAIIQPCFAQNKKIGFSGYLCMGVNSPTNYESSSNDLPFIDIAFESESNIGFEMGGVIYYRRIGLNFGFGYYKYQLDVDKYQTKKQNSYPNYDIGTYMTSTVNDVPVFTGLSYYFKLSNFYIEPVFLIRRNKVLVPDITDTYFWTDQVLEKIINYSKYSKSRLDYVPGINLSYYYTVSRELKIGIVASYKYSFSNPQFEFSKKEIDLVDNTFSEEIEKTTIKYSSSLFSFGLV